MKKLYDKNELTFAILWIVAYCVVCGTLRGNYGEGSIFMLLGLAVFAVGSFLFVKKNGLTEKYGLVKWKGKAADYLYFIPMLIPMTGNLWTGLLFGIKSEIDVAWQVIAALSMLLVGFVEEMIFRGFLFRMMLNRNTATAAVTVSAVTFGIGHIVNLLTGQASLETVIQIFFAVAWGFIFTFVFYKSGSLLMCIIVHSLIDVFSTFPADEGNADLTYVGFAYMFTTIFFAVFYCIYLSRKPAALEKE